jgi:hypothetical protein
MEIVSLVRLSANSSNTSKTAIDITQAETGTDNSTQIQPMNKNQETTTETAEALVTNQQQQALTDDQREVVQGGVYIGTQTDLLPTLPMGMHVENFSHTDMFAQQTKIAGFNWDPSATVGTILYQVSIPDVFDDVCSLSRNMLQVYAFFKPTVTVRFQINATRFQCGKLLIFADPANYWFDQSNRSIYSASAMPFVEIDVSSSNSAELTIPFEYVSNYLLTTTINPMGPNPTNNEVPLASIRVLVLNQLQNQQGDTTPIQVAAYMRMDAVDPNVAVYQHNLFDANPTSLVEHLNKPRTNQGIGETVSKGAKVVGEVADGVSGIAKTIGNAAEDFFNLDKPTMPDSHNLGHLSTTAPLCYMFGKETCVRLATNPLSNYMDNKFSLASRDETSIDKIIQQPTLIAQSDWSDTMMAETEILNIPVCPYSQHSTDPTRPLQYDVINPSWLEYIGFYHQQWSGDIIYRLSFASTQIHSGRLQISFEPGVDITPITGGPLCPVTIQRSSMPYAIFDLREHKEFVFRVSYVGTTETKTFRPCNEVGELGNRAMLHKTGNLRVTVLTPLRVSSNIASTIQMNTWIAAAPNFRYDYPQRSRSVINRDDHARLPPVPPPTRRNQGSTGYLYPATNTQPLVGTGTDASARSLPLSGPNLLKSTQIRPVRDRFGERVSDVRDLAKRPSCYYYTATLVDDPDHNKKSITIPISNTPIGVLNAGLSAGTSDNMLYNFAQMYAYWCGAIRYKVIPRTSRNDALHVVCTYLHQTDAPDPPLGSGLFGPIHVQNCSQDNGVEFEIPYISPFTQCMVRNANSLITLPYTSTGIANIAFDYDEETPRTVAAGIIAVSAGNDMSFRWLCFPPVMYATKIV